MFQQIGPNPALEAIVYFKESVAIIAQPAEATCRGEQPRLQSRLQCYWHQSHCRSTDFDLLTYNEASRWAETVRVHSSRRPFQVLLLHNVSSALGARRCVTPVEARISCAYRYTVIASTQDTKGECLKVQEYIRPGMPGTPQHMQRCSADMHFCTDVCCVFLLA